MLQNLYYPFSAILSVKWPLTRDKNQKIQTFGFKSGRGRLRKVVAYKIGEGLNFWYFGKLVAERRCLLTGEGSTEFASVYC